MPSISFDTAQQAIVVQGVATINVTFAGANTGHHILRATFVNGNFLPVLPQGTTSCAPHVGSIMQQDANTAWQIIPEFSDQLCNDPGATFNTFQSPPTEVNNDDEKNDIISRTFTFSHPLNISNETMAIVVMITDTTGNGNKDKNKDKKEKDKEVDPIG